MGVENTEKNEQVNIDHDLREVDFSAVSSEAFAHLAADLAEHTQQNSQEARQEHAHNLAELRKNPEAVRELFIKGKYPYKTKMDSKEYEQRKRLLQI